LSSKLIIIGASQTGLYCARELAVAGWPVEVYEQQTGVQSVPCRTLIVTPEFQKWWPLPEEVEVKNVISAFRVRAGVYHIDVPIAEPDLIVDRRDLIAALYREAQKAGAQIHSGVQLISAAPGPDGIDLLFLNRKTGNFFKRTSRILIAADGARSTVAQCLNCNGKMNVPILQARIRSRKPIDRRVVDTWFIPERTPYFYWQIPDSEYTAAAGFVARDTRSARREFLRFLDELGYETERVEAALVPLYEPGEKPYRRFGKGTVYLVGDSAGHVKVTTVGGTVTGLAGAAAAVRSIVNGTDYWDELKDLRRELNVHYWIRKVMDQFSTEDYVHLIRCLNRRVLDVLHETNRDRFAGVFFKVLAAQPRLIALGAKALLKAAWKEFRTA